jgi:hypothetical protein
VLYFIRTFFAAWSVRVTRRAQFPFWLYNLYLLGMLCVVIAAVSAYGSKGWTGALREYCVVGLYFYGLLMPACSKRQLMQLAKGFVVAGTLTMLAGIAIRYNNRQLWVLMPIAGSFAPLLILGGGRMLTCLWVGFYSLVGFAFATKATFTLLLLWAWNMIAGISLGLFGRNSLRWAVVTGLTCALLAVTLSMLFYAALWQDEIQAALGSWSDLVGRHAGIGRESDAPRQPGAGVRDPFPRQGANLAIQYAQHPTRSTVAVWTGGGSDSHPGLGPLRADR